VKIRIQLIGLRKSAEEFPVDVSFGEVLKNGDHIFTVFKGDVANSARHAMPQFV
jgi:hypothetical protein